MKHINHRKESSKVDLRKCKTGDKLLTIHGMILTYVKPLGGENYYDHEVMYPNGSYGNRTHDGFVFRNNRQFGDHDIIKILG